MFPRIRNPPKPSEALAKEGRRRIVGAEARAGDESHAPVSDSEICMRRQPDRARRLAALASRRSSVQRDTLLRAAETRRWTSIQPTPEPASEWRATNSRTSAWLAAS